MPEQIPVPELQEDKTYEKDLNNQTTPENLDLDVATAELSKKSDNMRNQIEQDPNISPEAKASRLEMLVVAKNQAEDTFETIVDKQISLRSIYEYFKKLGLYGNIGNALFILGAINIVKGQLDLAFSDLVGALLFNIIALLLERKEGRDKKESGEIEKLRGAV
jgi:hypothetical protein